MKQILLTECVNGFTIEYKGQTHLVIQERYHEQFAQQYALAEALKKASDLMYPEEVDSINCFYLKRNKSDEKEVIESDM